MSTMHRRLEDAALRLVEMLHPEWVGALPEALDALHVVLKQYLPALRELDIHDALIEALDEVEA